MISTYFVTLKLRDNYKVDKQIEYEEKKCNWKGKQCIITN